MRDASEGRVKTMVAHERARQDGIIDRAIREALAKLHARGEIHAPPSEIPRYAEKGIEQWLAEIPPDVFWLFRTNRLLVLSQKDRHAPEGMFERGWVVYDAEEVPIGEKRTIPPEDPLSAYQIRY